MGMFDYVKCEPLLPDGWNANDSYVELQTKDFDCAMTTVKITADGQLMIQDFEYEVVPKDERPYPNEDGALGLAGSLRRVNERWRVLDFHGVMEFYGSERLGTRHWVVSAARAEGGFWQPDERWHEYQAKFTDGRLVGITQVYAGVEDQSACEASDAPQVPGDKSREDHE